MSGTLCDQLAPHVQKIAGSADRQSVRYVPPTWQSWLKLAGVSPTVADRVFSATSSDTVSRPQIRILAQDASSADGRLALFVAVLVWGRGTANGRMRDAIVRSLTHADRDEVLEKTARLAQSGAAADAYNAWSLPGLQAAFFTKWLWAATSLKPHTCCLVLDSRVWKSLGAGLGQPESNGRTTRLGVAVRRLREGRSPVCRRVGARCHRRRHRVHPLRINGNLDGL
jgi:hypothetical protein